MARRPGRGRLPDRTASGCGSSTRVAAWASRTRTTSHRWTSSGWAAGIADELATWHGRTGLADARLLLEPGRFLVGPAGAYLARVVRTKPRGGRTMAIVDGGIHHLLRPALVGEPQRIVAVGEAARRDTALPTSVVGPLCTGLDMLSLEVSLPALRSGDLLAVLDAGAYGFTESMPLFLSHPMPAEVVVSGRRGTGGAAPAGAINGSISLDLVSAGGLRRIRIATRAT